MGENWNIPEREILRRILGNLIVQCHAEDEDEIDENALLREIDAATQGTPPVSDVIIEERREGP